MEVTQKTFTASQKRSLQTAMLAWFAEHARTLPWRGTRDLYAIWLSEIMLQQTQVATVIGYFNRFLAKFPNVADLAAADEHDVLALWEGLGYYRRARQLHAAAKKIVVEHDGQFPETFDEVLALPGIGRYTAGAILSIGRDEQLPILEANTIRVLARLACYREDSTTTAARARLWQLAEELLPNEHIGAFNQSLMELGALICTPRSPRCLLCPARKVCQARKAGVQEQIPPPKKKVYEEVTEAAIVLRRRDGKVLVRKHLATERWAGLWDFARFAIEDVNDVSKLRDEVKRLTGQTVQELTKLTTLRHGVTRYRITLEVLEAVVTRVSNSAPPDGSETKWLAVSELKSLAMSTTGRKISNLLAAAVTS